jgi:mycothiol S-conjugate amidase
VAAERLRLMAVHAHPDDESSKGAAAMARYVAEGVDVLVATCTGGERGSVLNPKLQGDPAIEADMPQIRAQEMEAARRILGVRQAWLGFVDSGLPEGDPLPPLPEGCFALVPVEEAAEPLVRLVREFRPHVMTTYDENGGYPHPDHIQCHRISVAAFDAAGDPERFPDAGPPFQPLKLYYTGWTRIRLQTLHDAFVARGEESPYADWLAKWDPETPDRPMTTRIDVGDYLDQRRAALLAHRTQVDPEGFWMRLPEEVVREVFPWEEFLLARSLVDAEVPEGGFEDDLFSGLRVGTSAERRAG